MTDTIYEILLVDDDPDLLKLISLRLSAAGLPAFSTAESAETRPRATGRARDLTW
ncbi:MAG: hypothetical protein MZW92_39055 [Comamonadaceae bacterium]|nr:hypothetical protein [Comamonadaceae bacterium]